MSEAAENVVDTHQTKCCIVGGGPGGVLLTLFLARQGIPVTLLESHPDFDRDFRGDTVHPATLEVLDQLGLADELLKLPHGKLVKFNVVTPEKAVTLVDLNLTNSRFRYIAMIPQAQFLDFVAQKVSPYPSARIVMSANVQRLVEENGRVLGVRYRDKENQWHEVSADLTVAADGRFSRIRHLSGLEPISTAPPMDILWMRVPRLAADTTDVGGIFVDQTGFLVLFAREDSWQIGYVIPKDGFQKVKTAGLEPLQQSLLHLVPWFGDRVKAIDDWKKVTVLSVASNRLEKWHRPGLLFIGDAAHTMSPVGGVGINYAIGDAVEAANVLIPKFKAGSVTEADLAEVQRRREGPVKTIQSLQGFIQSKVVAPGLDKSKPFQFPLIMRILPRVPLFNRLPARMIAFGPKRVRLEQI